MPYYKNCNFNTTRWSVIEQAAAKDNECDAEALKALERLCQEYWYPLYAYARSRLLDVPSAEDMTQGFFEHLLRKDFLGIADRRRGKFRWFLLTAFKNYMANDWARQRALKRGGGKSGVELDALTDEKSYQVEPSNDLSPDVLYERRWALMVIQKARDILKQEFIDAGKEDRFFILECYLPGEESHLTYAEIAPKLHSTEGAIKVEVHRMKKRYSELVRAEVARTVADENEVEEEIQHLMAALSVR